MKFKRELIIGLLGSVLFATPVTGLAASNQVVYDGVTAGHVQQADWWQHHRDERFYRGGPHRDGRWGNGYGYGAGRYAGPCGRAERLQNQARIDARTGHPAAANDLAHFAADARGNCR